MMFRAYIKDTDDLEYNDVPHKGHFIYGNLIKGIPNDSIDAIVGNLIGVTDEYIWWCPIEKGLAEQSTGLKDANGDDIYENDLVSLDPDDPPYQVIFDEGKFELSNDDLKLIYDLSETHVDCDIVGNVHENLDLLEAKHE